MSKPYYASFFVHDAGEEAVTQYCGVIEMRPRNDREIGSRELAALLAQNLDVETDDVEVLQWGPVHEPVSLRPDTPHRLRVISRPPLRSAVWMSRCR